MTNKKTVLGEKGIYMWLWPRSSWKPLEPDVVCPLLQELGIYGVIPQNGVNTLKWITQEKIDGFAKHGIKVCVGFGLDSKLTTIDQKAQVIIEAITLTKANQDKCVGVMNNWEQFWSGKKTETKLLVEKVLAAHPDASDWCTDAPWWAPLFLITEEGKKLYTHPSAPTKEWGKLCSKDRYPQTYGANKPGSPDGTSQKMLDWSRHPSQYASLGNWIIRPSLQGYKRSLNDHIQFFIKEPVICLWDMVDIDSNCANALRVFKKLNELGFDGPRAVLDFQKSVKITQDNIVGPKTLQKLGVDLK